MSKSSVNYEKLIRTNGIIVTAICAVVAAANFFNMGILAAGLGFGLATLILAVILAKKIPYTVNSMILGIIQILVIFSVGSAGNTLDEAAPLFVMSIAVSLIYFRKSVVIVSGILADICLISAKLFAIGMPDSDWIFVIKGILAVTVSAVVACIMIDLGKERMASEDGQKEISDIPNEDILLPVEEVPSVTDELKAPVGEVKKASCRAIELSQALNNNTDEQISIMERLKASADDMEKFMSQSLDSSETATEIAMKAGEKLQSESTNMAEMLSAMEDISKVSGEIEKIIHTIDDIAFQTNILALNAAVEAARAGEAGKGFSVVAGEVRNLANKSAGAANSTSSLIARSAAAVERGSEIANTAAVSLTEIVESAKESTKYTAAVNEAIDEERKILAEVAENMSAFSEKLRSSSELSAESLRALQEINAKTEEIKQIIG